MCGRGVSSAADLDFGLSVVTFPSGTEEFTGLTLDAGAPIPLKGEPLSLSFDIYNRPANVFGCIFRILTDKGENVDLMYTADLKDVRTPLLVTGPDVHSIDCPIPLEEWIPVSVSLDPRDGCVEVDYNGTRITVRDAGTKGAKSFRIAFGFCPFVGYSLSDVASVNLRNISIDLGGKPFRRWALARHAGDICYDDLAGAPAQARNPEWMIDQYASFRHVFSHSFNMIPSVTFDDDATFYMAGASGPIYAFSVEDGSMKEIAVKGGHNPANYPNQLFYVAGGHDWLTAYNLDEGLFSRFNMTTGRWDNDTLPEGDHNFWNNTNAWEPEVHAMYSFGGYGHYHYRNDLIVSYLDEPEKNTHTTIPEITPRYSSTSYIVDTLMYVFGGRGNPSGKQELSPQNYYDFYAIDTRDLSVRELWDMGRPEWGDFVASENFVYNWENGDFYLLSNLDGFTLLKLRADKPGLEKMSLPIPPMRNAQYNYLNIWHSYSRGKIYAVVLQSQVNNDTDVDVFEINYPPLPVSEILQESRESSPRRLPEGFWWKMAVGLLILLLIIGNALNYILLRRRRKAAQHSVAPLAEEEEETVTYYDFSRSSVTFFGGFKVTDKHGEDITAQFTPTLKALLILLVLHTNKFGGIPSQKINHIMWSYKRDDTANNNRNVYMSKLRSLLEEVGDVNIQSQNRLWNISFDGDTQCDYLAAARLFREGTGEEDVDRLLELFLRGTMLPNTELDWVDDFKSDFSSSAIDFLIRQLSRTDLSDRTLLKAADTIMQHDFLSEEALRAKVRIFCRQSKPGLAKNIYDNFCKEYRKSLGIDYKVSLKDLM